MQIHLAIAYDPAFNPSSTPVTLSNIVFERASLLFNLAALCSQLATLENRSTTEGIKRAAFKYQVRLVVDQTISKFLIAYFIGQQAAGTLSYLHSSVLPNLIYSPDEDEIPQDLSKDFIKGLECLMLAQAQECTWQLARLSTFHYIMNIVFLNSFRSIQEFFDR